MFYNDAIFVEKKYCNSKLCLIINKHYYKNKPGFGPHIYTNFEVSFCSSLFCSFIKNYFISFKSDSKFVIKWLTEKYKGFKNHKKYLTYLKPMKIFYGYY